MTAAVRPGSESTPQRCIISAAAPSAPEPDSGRSSRSSAVSSGMPRRDSTGAARRTNISGRAEARKRYIAANSTVSAGSMSSAVFSPRRAPSLIAPMMSTPFATAASTTAAVTSAGSSESTRLISTPSSAAPQRPAPPRATRASTATPPAECRTGLAPRMTRARRRRSSV